MFVPKKIRRSNRRVFRRYLRIYSSIPRYTIRRMKYRMLSKYFDQCSRYVFYCYDCGCDGNFVPFLSNFF